MFCVGVFICILLVQWEQQPYAELGLDELLEESGYEQDAEGGDGVAGDEQPLNIPPEIDPNVSIT
jgi:hypothetical protein